MADAKKEKLEASEEEEEEMRDDFADDDHLFDDWDDLAADPEEVSRLGRTLEGLLPDIVKRGVEGLVSEDGIRAIVTDRGLPREAVGFVLGQADATRREIVRMVSKEVRMFLENVDLGGELTKILTSVSFEIRTEVRFIPNDASVKADVRNRVGVRSNREEKADEKQVEAADPIWPDEEDLDEDSGRGKRKSRLRRWPLGRRNDDGEKAGDEDPPPKSSD